MELVDTSDSKSDAPKEREGSNPSRRTMTILNIMETHFITRWIQQPELAAIVDTVEWAIVEYTYKGAVTNPPALIHSCKGTWNNAFDSCVMCGKIPPRKVQTLFNLVDGKKGS